MTCCNALSPRLSKFRSNRVFRELGAPRFSPALAHVKSAIDFYNARPRNDLGVCTNIFDALESVAKEVFSLPNRTFGDVLKLPKLRGSFSAQTISPKLCLHVEGSSQAKASYQAAEHRIM